MVLLLDQVMDQLQELVTVLVISMDHPVLELDLVTVLLLDQVMDQLQELVTVQVISMDHPVLELDLVMDQLQELVTVQVTSMDQLQELVVNTEETVTSQTHGRELWTTSTTNGQVVVNGVQP
jgi:ABC-type transporter Mla maintaining outer membrane lipid asymmetry ATPase subunit MlaF